MTVQQASDPIGDFLAYRPTSTLVEAIGDFSQDLANKARAHGRTFNALELAEKLAAGRMTTRQARVVIGDVEHGPEFAWCADCQLLPLDPDAPACPRCGERGIVTSDHEARVYAEACHRRDYGGDPVFRNYR
jgi:ribosomal protein S27AE